MKIRKSTIENQLSGLHSRDGSNQMLIDIGWITLTYGNGSDQEPICNNPTIMNKVRDLIIVESQLELDDIIKQMEDL